MSHTRLAVEGLTNVRDLGGLLRRDGTRTPAGVFVRSEQLASVTPSGWDTLRAHGVRTIVDLRRPAERMGTVPADMLLVETDLDGDEPAFWAAYEADGRWGTPLYYADHLARLPMLMGAALDAIARAPAGAVLFHCGAGWDRTGFVTAMLLRAADVIADEAVADYMRSYDNAEARTALHGHESHAALRRRVLAHAGTSPERAFSELYASLDLDHWFETARLATPTRAAVRSWRSALPATGQIRGARV